MPLSTSSCRGRCDANVATERRAGRRPARGRRARCAGREVLNTCELAEGGPFVLAFVFDPVARCVDQIPALERVAARHRDVKFRIVAVRADAAPGARAAARTCPSATTTTARSPTSTRSWSARRSRTSRRGGRVVGSTVGPQSKRTIEAWVRAPWVSRRSTPATVEPAIAAELPGLGLRGARSRWRATCCGARRRRCASGCAALSDRHRGATAIALRSRSIPHAYRALFRHLGLEPGRGPDPGRGADARAAQARRLPLARAAAGRAAGRRRWRPRSACGRSTRTGSTGAPRLALEGGRIVVAAACARLFAAAAAPVTRGDAPARALRDRCRRACRRSRSRRRCWIAWDIVDSGRPSAATQAVGRRRVAQRDADVVLVAPGRRRARRRSAARRAPRRAPAAGRRQPHVRTVAGGGVERRVGQRRLQPRALGGGLRAAAARRSRRRSRPPTARRPARAR